MSPTCLIFKSLWQYLRVYLSIWQNFEPIVAALSCHWANVNCLQMAKYCNIIWPSGHTEREPLMHFRMAFSWQGFSCCIFYQLKDAVNQANWSLSIRLRLECFVIVA